MEDLTRDLLLIAKGNELAFNEFMNRYMEGIYYHAYGILSNKEMAEEVVSDVFFEAWRNRKMLYLRKEKKHDKNIAVEEIASFTFPETETPIDGIINKEELNMLDSAINALPTKCKHVFYLAKFEQLPYTEIAQILEISIATINYHVSTAMSALKKKLAHA